MDGYFRDYGVVALVLLAGVLVVTGALTANRLLRPAPSYRARRGSAAVEVGLAPYECGVAIDPTERTWAQANIRYYVYAFVYVIFAVETVFVYPWATVFAAPGFGAAALAEMGVFVGLLALGLLYAWRKRVLVWT